MKKFLTSIICASLLLFFAIKSDYISTYIAEKITTNPSLVIKEKNSYAKEEGFKFVSISNDFIPYSYNDLLNIIYTTINNGWETFTFYCPSEYQNCINDIENISNDNLTLTHINNYVHPFNSFTNLKTTYLKSGEITLEINYLYTSEQIVQINTEVDRLMNLLIKNDVSTYENIKTVHDYIINNTKYDVERNEGNSSKYLSYIAYGVLFEHKATCNGYTDLMAIMLTKMGLKNFKIATTEEDLKDGSTGHVWNAVFLEDKWLHIDLTWDDPVSDDGKDYLYHKYFLVTTNELLKADSGDVKIEEHNFNKAYYLEFNEAIKEITSS